VQFSVFFRKWARNRGVGIAKEVLEEVTRISSKRYPPASRPGQPPAMRTGKFVRSGRVIRTANGAIIRWYAPYSGFLQYGTKFMGPRPYFDIALKNVLKRRKRGKK